MYSLTIRATPVNATLVFWEGHDRDVGSTVARTPISFESEDILLVTSGRKRLYKEENLRVILRSDVVTGPFYAWTEGNNDGS